MSPLSLPALDTQAIHWPAPWLAHLPPYLPQIAAAPDLKAALNQHVTGLSTGQNLPLHFIAQADLPAGVAYESHIFNTGGVPTRLNLHDFFNAAVWLTFPRSKAALNARQAEQIAAHGVQHERGVARDALTLFDENAAILVTSNPDIAQYLRNFNWRGALIEPRAQWDNPAAPRANAQAALYAFGHALMEKLTAPYPAICAHTWIVNVPPDWFAQPLPQRLCDLDTRLAEQLRQTALNPRDFCPLPILGVPHFWADNAAETFYNDTRVFRSGRTRLRPSSTHNKETPHGR
ncbi:MAG: DUF3025 domain-containing protein [Formosimonas sp.]